MSLVPQKMNVVILVKYLNKGYESRKEHYCQVRLGGIE
jgi:hypothetical protein